MSELKILNENAQQQTSETFGQKFSDKFEDLLNTITKVHIEFENLTFATHKPSLAKLGEMEVILHSISGRFCSGEVSAIIGESGAGKTTLLNILAGYVHSGVTGSVKVNGKSMKARELNRISSYIFQDSVLPRLLSSEEVLQFAAELKFGKNVSRATKKYLVDEIITVLRLTHCKTTWTDQLSGGERKRLSIALGLINNPPVLFLDEPTTGLDITTAKEVTSVMSQLARQGRTIICTIHQPTASIYQQFDHVYVLGRGQCVYQGSTEQLVPFLSSAGFDCPITYNPADYVLECVFGENSRNIGVLSKRIKNGQDVSYCKKAQDEIIFDKSGKTDVMEVNMAASYFRQTYLLVRRDFLQKYRDKTQTIIMWIYTLSCSTVLGLTFLNMGGDGARTLNNYLFLIGLFTYSTFTFASIAVAQLPLQVRNMNLEYFNGWYNMSSYFTTVIITYLPNHIIYGPVFFFVCYGISGQPMEINRILWILLFTFVEGQISEAIGHIFGSWFEEKHSFIVCLLAVSLPITLLFSGYGYDQPYPDFLDNLSFIKLAVIGAALSLFKDREILPCVNKRNNNYCHYRDPSKFLKDFEMNDKSMYELLLPMLFIYIVCRVSTYVLLKLRLDLDFHERIKFYVLNLFRSLGINIKI